MTSQMVPFVDETVTVPVLLVPATGETPAPGEDARQTATRDAVRVALAALPDGDVAWYPGADHDLHAQHPERLAGDLLAPATHVESGRAGAASHQESTA